MRLPLSFILLLTIFLSAIAPSDSYAAFPSKSADETTILKEHTSFKQELKTAIKEYKKTAPQVTGKGGESADAFGVVSLICGVLGFIFLFLPTIGIVFIPLAIAALVFGILGLKGSHKGMSIAGLILGAVEVLLLILAIVFVAAIIASL